MAKILHIVNGDTVAETMRKGVVNDDILVWREVYPEGPVFEDMAQEEHLAYRAAFLERAMGIPQAEFQRTSREQEAALAGFQAYDEVVLWFEHDLFDQTMLSFLLHWFAQREHAATRLNILCIGSFPGADDFRGLGQLSPEQLSRLVGTWKPVTAEELELGSALWRAYASPDPEKLALQLKGDISALPFAHDAFELHLARFPSVFNGLGIVEQTILQQVHNGLSSKRELFKATGDRLPLLGMGDTQFEYIVREMKCGRRPLLTGDDSEIRLTDTGRCVLEGVDAVKVNGLDRWYGGVHLHGSSIPWRWDGRGVVSSDEAYA